MSVKNARLCKFCQEGSSRNAGGLNSSDIEKLGEKYKGLNRTDARKSLKKSTRCKTACTKKPKKSSSKKSSSKKSSSKKSIKKTGKKNAIKKPRSAAQKEWTKFLTKASIQLKAEGEKISVAAISQRARELRDRGA